jgi:LysR family transcriptional regulator, regulator of abg operon
MTLKQLRDLIAIAEHGSLRAAARALGMSAPALVKTINGLETELHVPLLVRSSRGVMLSEYGKRLLHRARRIDAETRRAADEIAELRGRFESSITIGASPTPSVALVPQVLLAFRRKFPDVRVTIVGGLYHTHLDTIRSGSMDLALGPIPDAGLDAAFRSEQMFYNEVIIAARKGHPMAGIRSLGELSACEWILTGPNAQGPGAAILDAYRQHGLEPPRRMIQCDITWALQSLLLKSDMICALPRHLIEHEPLSALLCTIQVREELPRYVVSLFYRSDVPLLPTAEYFATLLRRRARQVARRYPELMVQEVKG